MQAGLPLASGTATMLIADETLPYLPCKVKPVPSVAATQQQERY